MNNPNPFVPKGSLLEQQSLRRSRLKLTVGCVLAVSVLGLVAMLIQGCKREQPAPTEPTNSVPELTSTNLTMDSSNAFPAWPTNPVASVAPVASNPPAYSQPITPLTQPITPVTEPVGATTTYEVVSGDTLGKIAKNHGVSLKALQDANPGVDSKKLKPKQKINIPPATAKTAEATTSTGTTAGTEAATGEKIYVVKSGDVLAKVAKKNGVTLKALRAANPKIATTDRIHVGDKLVIPGKAETVAPVTTPTETAPVTPMSPLPPTSAAGTTSPTAPTGH